MKSYLKKSLISGCLFALLLLGNESFSQKGSMPVSVSIFNEATAIPFTKFATRPIHPGFQVGSGFSYNQHRNHQWLQTINLIYYFHSDLNHGIGIYTEFGYQYMFKNGISFSPILGVGYMRTYSVNEEFALDNGQYVKRKDKGNGRMMPSLSLEAGYYPKKNFNSTKFFLKYQAWAEYPYSPGFIPVMTHINLHAGVQFNKH